jgi:acetyl/propionyl-CoA carboxylase alpha subunit
VASGAPLPFRQDELRATGHAIECRVYAEDARRLLPQSGRLLVYEEPAGEGIRVDSGVEVGQTVTVHYDPLLAKVIVHAPTRKAAADRLRQALGEFEILGLRHNISFLLALLANEAVRESRVHTRFIEEHFAELTSPPPEHVLHAAVAMAAWMASREPPSVASTEADDLGRLDPWILLGSLKW